MRLLCPGFAKCGTTDVWAKLGMHPDISLTATKELNFFDSNLVYSKGFYWYEEWFKYAFRHKREARILGEISPTYTNGAGLERFLDYYTGAPDGEIKLLICVRDPVEAYWSWLKMLQGERGHGDIKRSEVDQFRYSQIIPRFEEVFNDIKVVNLDTLCYNSIFEWLGVEPIDVGEENFNVNVNKEKMPYQTRLALRRMYEETNEMEYLKLW